MYNLHEVYWIKFKPDLSITKLEMTTHARSFMCYTLQYASNTE